MSDPLCVGVCMMDWETGVCMGCGRTSDEIDGVSAVPGAEDSKQKDGSPAPTAGSEVGQGAQ